MHACKALSVTLLLSSTYKSGSSIGTLVSLFHVFIESLHNILVLSPTRFLWWYDCYFRSWLKWSNYHLTCKYLWLFFCCCCVCCTYVFVFYLHFCCCIACMLGVCISVWFCFGLFLYCMHVYCEYVCYLLSICHPIHVDSCISITLYAVSRYAVYVYVCLLLYVHSMYVHYLYTCIYNSLSCIVVCLVLFGCTRYVCELICYCYSENSRDFAFWGVVLVLLHQDLLPMIMEHLDHGNLPWT